MPAEDSSEVRRGSQIKYYSGIKLALNVSKDMLEELERHHEIGIAYKIYCVTLLRIVRHGIPDSMLGSDTGRAG